jgi:hypothetical protein
MKPFVKTIAAVAVGAVGMAALVAGGAVFASDGLPSSSTGAALASPRERLAGRLGDEHHRLLAGAGHVQGTWLLVDGTTRTTTSDRGTISSVGPDSITIDRPDGQQVTAPVEPGACIRRDGLPAFLSDLAVGDRAMVTQSNGTTLAIRSGLPPREPGRPRQGCGLLALAAHGDLTVSGADGSTRTVAFDAGVIASIGEADISIHRDDGQTVTLAWNADTVVLEEGAIRSVSDLSEGERAMFVSEGGTALIVRCVRPVASS